MQLLIDVPLVAAVAHGTVHDTVRVLTTDLCNTVAAGVHTVVLRSDAPVVAALFSFKTASGFLTINLLVARVRRSGTCMEVMIKNCNRRRMR